MIIFNCSDNATAFFNHGRSAERLVVSQAPSANREDDSAHLTNLDGSEVELSQWLIDVQQVEGKSVIFAIEEYSLYSMVFADMQPGNTEDFLKLFFERWLNNMQDYGESFGVLTQEGQPKMLKQLFMVHGEYRFYQRGMESADEHLQTVSDIFTSKVEEIGSLPDNGEQAAAFDDLCNQLRCMQDGEHFYPFERMLGYWLPTCCEQRPSQVKYLLAHIATLRDEQTAKLH